MINLKFQSCQKQICLKNNKFENQYQEEFFKQLQILNYKFLIEINFLKYLIQKFAYSSLFISLIQLGRIFYYSQFQLVLKEQIREIMSLLQNKKFQQKFINSKQAFQMAFDSNNQHLKKDKLLKTQSQLFHNKHSSIESIHRLRYKYQSSSQKECPLKILKYHAKINRSFDQTKSKGDKQSKKKQAYLFFEDQKQKKMNIIKHETYLLPKLCKKRRRQTNFKINQQQSQANKTICQKQKSQKIQKFKSFGNHRESLSTKKPHQNQLKQKISIFKNKCQQQLKNIKLTLPKQRSGQNKCFFELSSRDIENLYKQENEKQVDMNTYLTQNLNISQIKNRNKKIDENCKFKQIKFNKIQLEQNTSTIPSFLLQRLSSRKPLSQHGLSFLNQNAIINMLALPTKTKANQLNKVFEKQNYNNSQICPFIY